MGGGMMRGDLDRRVSARLIRSWPLPLGLWAVAGAAVATLAVYALCGMFTRYVADDYCMAASLRHYSWVAAQSHWYETWSGRFSATALSTLAAFGGPMADRALPGLMIASLLLVSWLVMRHIAGLDRLAALALGAVTTYAVIRTAPDVTESVFWLTGASTYMPPMILTPLIAVAVVRRGQSRSLGWLTLIGLLAFLSAGFSETGTALQVTGLGLLVGLAFLPGVKTRLRDLRTALMTAFVSTLVATAVVILAPGNAVRQASYPPHPSVVTAAVESLILAAQFTVSLVAHNVDVVALVAGTAAVLGWEYGSKTGRPVPGFGWGHVGWTAWAAILTVMCMLPAYWAESSPPPDRTEINACFVLTGWIAAAGLWTGLRLGSAWRTREASKAEMGSLPGTPVPLRRSPISQRAIPATLLALAILPLITAATTLRHVPSLADWSNQADLLESQLAVVAGSGRDVVITWSPKQPARPLLYSASLMPGPDATDWVNVCIADDYALKSLSVVP
jgi:hypothetical protein